MNRKIILLLTGLLFITALLSNRFLRVHIPKDIPFIITDVKFILLLTTCIIFLQFLFILLRDFHFIRIEKENIFYPLISFLKESLQELDFNLRNNRFLWKQLYGLSIKIFIFCYKYIRYSKYIYFLCHFPKILLPLILVVDIFYNHHIDLFYKLLIILIIINLSLYLSLCS